VQIFNPELIRKLADQRLLLRDEISSLKLQDEHIFSLLCCFAGMQLGDFGGAASPMSVGWQELVDSPDSLVRAEKKVIHSVRKWGKWSEDDIRTYFHARRNATEEALEAERAEILNTSPVDF
jgi:hypothetical protein